MHPQFSPRRVSVSYDYSDSSDCDERTALARLRSAVTGGHHHKSHHRNKADKKRRVVEKDGDPNIQYKNISKKRRRYILDLFTTLVDSGQVISNFFFRNV